MSLNMYVSERSDCSGGQEAMVFRDAMPGLQEEQRRSRPRPWGLLWG